jgi:condensin-2 complex subunit G2
VEFELKADTFSFVMRQDIVAEHASDISASAVRVGAVNAVSVMLDAPQTHAVLRELLPQLTNLIHDRVEQVRLAVVRMLIQIKKLPGFKYYRICPVDHLILRLSEEGRTNATGSVASALTSLMINSYLPDGPNVDCAEQIRRTLKFLSQSDEAALVFYANISKFRSTHAVGQLTFQLLSCLHSLVEEQEKRERRLARAKNGKKRRVSTDGDEDSDSSEADGDNEHLPAQVLASLAETVVILWKSIETKLHGHEKWNQFLLDEFSGPKLTFVLTFYERKIKNLQADTGGEDEFATDLDCYHQICSSILHCAAMLPTKAVDGLVPYIFSVLSATKSFDETCDSLTSHVALLCHWGMVDEVASSLSESVRSSFSHNTLFGSPESPVHMRRSGRSRTSKEVLSIPLLPPRVALHVLGDILRGTNPSCQSARAAIMNTPCACDVMETTLAQGTRQAEFILDDTLVRRLATKVTHPSTNRFLT